MDAKRWMTIFFCVTLVSVVGIGSMIFTIDPYFHYRKPRSDVFYELKYERYINPGILKQFDYNGLIIGTSMCQNFKTSEFDELFGVHSVKTCAQGASYAEINLLENIALEVNPDIKIVVRGLDYNKLDWMEDGLETENLPMYLYDYKTWNDIEYLLNRETIINMRTTLVQMLKNPGRGGITSFDDYENWMSEKTFGIEAVRKDILYKSNNEDGAMVAKENNIDMNGEFNSDAGEKVIENIKCNVTQSAKSHPEVNFYFFFTPYSIFYWEELKESGTLHRQIEMEKCAIEEMLRYPNVRLYSFNMDHDIVEDLDNYGDVGHYGEWINSIILKKMLENDNLLTKDNYINYLIEEENYYSHYDYTWLWEEDWQE